MTKRQVSKTNQEKEKRTAADQPKCSPYVVPKVMLEVHAAAKWDFDWELMQRLFNNSIDLYLIAQEVLDDYKRQVPQMNSMHQLSNILRKIES